MFVVMYRVMINTLHGVVQHLYSRAHPNVNSFLVTDRLETKIM